MSLLRQVTILTSRLNIDINNEIFPLNYSDPYPITRGIQVETGAIVIVCALGIVCQMKVWKIIRIRRDEKAREQRRRDEERNVADEERGRTVEDGIKRERGSWEAAYGSGERVKFQHLDSGIGMDETSIRKGSLSIVGTSDVRGSDPESTELQEMGASPNGPKEGGKLTVHDIKDDGIFPTLSATGQQLTRSSSITESREPSIHESQTGASKPFGSEASRGNAAALRSVGQNLTLEPKVTHLPFKVPDPDSGSEDGRSSVAAAAASEHMADRWVNRLSGSSIARQLSKRSERSFIAASTLEEASMIPDIEHDRASSVVATIDGVSEKDHSEEGALSVRDQRPSFEILQKQDSIQTLMLGTHPSADLGKDAEKLSGQSANPIALGESQAVEAQHFNGSMDPRPEFVALPDSEIASNMTVEEPNLRSRASATAESEASEQRPRISSLSANLPEGASRVVTAYRTNEWAKHLDGADLPAIDELRFKNPQVPESSHPTEHVAPVNVRALQQTTLNAEPAPILTVKSDSLGDRPASYFQSKNPFQKPKNTQQLKPTVHQLTREKITEKSPPQTSLADSMERSPSQTSLSSTQSRKEQYRPPLPKFRSSQPSVPSAHGFRRSSSIPLISSPLVESPIEEGVEASFPARFTPSSMHLMSQRDSILRNKPSSTSLLRTNWSNAALDQHPALRALNEDENISLSQRKSLLQQNPQSIPQMHRSSSGPILGAATPISPHNDAHTPIHSRSRPSLTPQPMSRHPSLSPRDSTISAWRASLQASLTAHHRDREIEAHRATLIAEKRRESTSRQEQRVSQTLTQTVKDRGMRQSSMIELHQQQMRKMQAEANKSLA